MKLLFITHDMSRTGAPISLVNVIKHIRQIGGIHISILALAGGVLEKEFEAVSDELFYYRSKKTFIDKVYNRVMKKDIRLALIIQSHKKHAFDVKLNNTVIAAPILIFLLKSVSPK